MKKFFTILLGLTAAILTAAETAPQIADFENGKIQAGPGTAAVRDAAFKEVPAAFEAGLHGQALALDKQGVHFPVKGLITPEQGAVSFWFKPVNWPQGAVSFLPVFAVDTGRGHGWKMLCYYYYRPAKEVCGFLTLQLFTKSAKVVTVVQLPVYKNLKFNDWNHLTISWDKSSAAIGFNGKQFVRKDLPKDFVMMPPHSKDCAVILPALFWKQQSTVKTLVDDVTFFPEALTKEAAAAVFEAR